MKNPEAFSAIVLNYPGFDYFYYSPGRYILRDALHKPFQNNILKMKEIHLEIKIIENLIKDFRKASGV